MVSGKNIKTHPLLVEPVPRRFKEHAGLLNELMIELIIVFLNVALENKCEIIGQRGF